MEPSSLMPRVPYGKAFRPGQQRVFDAYVKSKRLTIQLPTGYGKTVTALGCFYIKKQQGLATRLLYIVPTIAQLTQFTEDGENDLKRLGFETPRAITDIGYYKAAAIKKHMKNRSQVFATTIQALKEKAVNALVHELFNTGKWMIVVDEHHHYGEDKSWGKTLTSFLDRSVCSLAMSATPYRPNGDDLFGTPKIEVLYIDATQENPPAVKKIMGHSYVYKLHVRDSSGRIISYTTDEFLKFLKTDNPDNIQRALIDREMRLSPKYIEPLIMHPLRRLQQMRNIYGIPLQAIFYGFCVSHAETICVQTKSLYGDELKVEWVGTGINGRTNEENKEILNMFCPKKDRNGNRNPQLDVLVNVGIAGEGLDSIYVTEESHFKPFNNNRQSRQEAGRPSRIIKEFPEIIAHINFDSSSYLSKHNYIGLNIMQFMDGMEPAQTQEEAIEDIIMHQELLDKMPLSEKPPSVETLIDLQLERIDSGSQELRDFVKETTKAKPEYENYFSALLKDKDSQEWQSVIEVYKKIHTKTKTEKDKIEEERQRINNLLSVIVGELASKAGTRTDFEGIPIVSIEKSLYGDIKKRINSRKKMDIGSGINNDLNNLKRHRKWLEDLKADIRQGEIDEWL